MCVDRAATHTDIVPEGSDKNGRVAQEQRPLTAYEASGTGLLPPDSRSGFDIAHDRRPCPIGGTHAADPKPTT